MPPSPYVTYSAGQENSGENLKFTEDSFALWISWNSSYDLCSLTFKVLSSPNNIGEDGGGGDINCQNKTEKDMVKKTYFQSTDLSRTIPFPHKGWQDKWLL